MKNLKRFQMLLSDQKEQVVESSAKVAIRTIMAKETQSSSRESTVICRTAGATGLV